jgi:hypothetical protein
MKKILYLFLTLLIVGCSGDDSNDGTTLNSQFVGSWLLEGTEEVYSLIIEFNAEGTGSSTEIYDGTTENVSLFTWSTTNTYLTITFSPDDNVSVVEYEFITNDKLRIIDSEDETDVAILNRIPD